MWMQLLSALMGAGVNAAGNVIGPNPASWGQNAALNVFNLLQDQNRFGVDQANVYGDLLRNYYMPWAQEGQEFSRGMLPELANAWRQGMEGVGGAYSNPRFDQLFDQWQGSANRFNAPMDRFAEMIDHGGRTPESTGMMEQLWAQFGGQTNPQQALSRAGMFEMDNRGENNFGRNASDRGIDVMNAFGQYAPLNNVGGAAFNNIANQGQTDFSRQIAQGGLGAFNSGMDLFLNPTRNTGSPYGDAGANFANSYLSDPSRASYNPFSRQATGNAQNFFDQVGNQDFTPGAQQQYGQSASLFNRAMQDGGQTPNLNAAFDRGYDLSFEDGYTPQLNQGMGMALNLMRGGGVSGPSISIDSGYTGSINEGLGKASAMMANEGYNDELRGLFDHSMKLYKGDPNAGVIQSLGEAQSMAQDQAATAGANQYEGLMRRAQQRGGGPGSVVGSGMANRAMGEFADQIAQAEAAALRQATATNQQQRLQQSLGGGDLAARAAGTAAQRESTGAGLYGNMEGAAAQRNAASASAAASAANANAQLQAAALQSGASLFGNLQNTAANRYGSSLGASTNLMNQSNATAADRYQAELNNSTELAGSADRNATARQGNLLQAGTSLVNNADQAATQRELGYLNTGSGLMQNADDNQAQRYGANLGASATMSGNGLDFLSAINNSANNNFLQSLNLIPQISQAEMNRVNTYGNIANNADQNAIARQAQGNDFLRTLLQSQNASGDQMRDIIRLENDRLFNASGAYGGYAGQQGGMYGGMYSGLLNNTNSQQQALLSMLGFGNNVFQNGMNMGQQGANGLGNLFTGYLGYGTNAMNGWNNIFGAPQASQNPWGPMLHDAGSALGNWMDGWSTGKGGGTSTSPMKSNGTLQVGGINLGGPGSPWWPGVANKPN